MSANAAVKSAGGIELSWSSVNCVIPQSVILRRPRSGPRRMSGPVAVVLGPAPFEARMLCMLAPQGDGLVCRRPRRVPRRQHLALLRRDFGDIARRHGAGMAGLQRDQLGMQPDGVRTVEPDVLGRFAA